MSLYTPDYPHGHVAVDHMEELKRPDGPDGHPGVAVHETSDGGIQFRPHAEMTVIRVEPCNPDSALGVVALEDERQFMGEFVSKLGIAGMKLLDHENDDRNRLHDMSKALGGDGVEPVEMIQFYAVFGVTFNRSTDSVEASLEGVLRLDKIDMAIDEAILL
ncbi:MAG: hypothetical protein ACOYB3_01565 [Azonexus sp.]